MKTDYEATLVIIKPDGYTNREGIKGMITSRGFEHLAIKEPYMFTREMAVTQYRQHADKPWFPELIEMMMEGPTSIIIYGKENAIADMMKLVGDTDPKKAEEGTIRKAFGTEIPYNAVHRSDSPGAVVNEVNLYFRKRELPADVKRVLEHYKISVK